MVQATAEHKGYPTIAVSYGLGLEAWETAPDEEQAEAFDSDLLTKEELFEGLRIAVRKVSGERWLGEVAAKVSRDIILLRPEEDLSAGRFGPAKPIKIEADDQLFLHPQQHLPDFDYASFFVSNIPKITPAPYVQTRLL